MPDPSAPPLLAVRDLVFCRDEMPLFGPLNFQLQRGELLLLRGDNGVGKTTLLRILAGLLRADNGEIRLDGELAGREARAHAIAYLGHLPGFKADLSAEENLAFLAALHGHHPERGLEAAMQLVGLGGYEDSLARTLSAGQKKRLSLAHIWRAPAPLWLLDEPYANLDLDGIDLVNRLVIAHLHAGGAALITTHGAYAAPPVPCRELHLARTPLATDGAA